MKLLEYFQRKKELKKARSLYKEVVKSFYDIKEKEVQLIFERFIDVAGFSFKEAAKGNPTISLGKYFFVIMRNRRNLYWHMN